MLRKPSDQQLENEFGSKRDTDVVEQILQKGSSQAADGIRADGGVLNIAVGSERFTVDVEGPGCASAT